MKQCYISESLAGLDFRARYGLTDYTDTESELIIFGIYRPEDLEVFQKHNSDITVVWQGMDARFLHEDWISIIKRKQAKHYSISHWIKHSLNEYGIDNEYLPISATAAEIKPCPKGDAIYFYCSDSTPASIEYYGGDLIPEIRKRTGLRVIRANYNQYPKDELLSIYRQCFINLRLTKYDGCPNTNLEMGLMGRRSIFNGDIPGSIKWNSVDDICENIIDEYVNRHCLSNLPRLIKDFLNIKFP